MTHLEREQLLDLLHQRMSAADRESAEVHLKQCPECNQAYSRLSKMRDYLAQRRTEEEGKCPSDEQFQKYIQRQLTFKEELEIQRHVLACPVCLEKGRIDQVQSVWEQHQREQEEAAEAYQRKQKVISLDEVRARLLTTLETTQEEEAIRPVYFTLNRFSQPVALDELGLISKEGVYAAAGGGEFKRVTVSEEGIPIEVELTHLGEQATVHIRITDRNIQNGLATITFLENQTEIFSCLIPLVSGKGKRTFTEQDYELLKQAPDQVQLRARVVSLPYDVSQAISLTLDEVRGMEDLLKVLKPLVTHPSHSVRRLAVCLLGTLCGEFSLDTLTSALNDKEDSIRQVAQQIVDRLSHG